MTQRSLSIFIPVYNEERIIDAIISSLLEVSGSITHDYEILIIDDGSSDGSREKALEWNRRDKRVKVVSHGDNRGYGAALRTGFYSANNDLVFYTDADMPVFLDELKKIPPLMEKYDMVIGYRLNRTEDKLRRYAYSKFYNLLLRLLLNVKVKDANFSFKCIKKEALNRITLNSRSVFIDGELLAEAVRNNLSIKELPLVYRPRQHGASNFDSLFAAMSAMKEIMYYWLSRKIFRKTVKGCTHGPCATAKTADR